MNFFDHIWNMSVALEEAEKAFREDEVPIGAVIVNEDNKIIAKAYNQKEGPNNPLGHAELLAIKTASEELGNWRLSKCTLYVTIEPCPMCLAAMIQARISKVVFGAYDLKGGALSLNYNLYKDQRLNHNFSVIGGVKHYDCASLMSFFFQEKRKDYNRKKRFNS